MVVVDVDHVVVVVVVVNHMLVVMSVEQFSSRESTSGCTYAPRTQREGEGSTVSR